ncbi:hypothetical protein ACFLQJ_02115 [Calditrichota bacterium]
MLYATLYTYILIGLGAIIFIFNYLPLGKNTITLQPLLGRLAGFGFVVAGVLIIVADMDTSLYISISVIILVNSSMVLLVIAMVKR